MVISSKNKLNENTGDLDWFDDESYNEDLSNVNTQNQTLASRVSANENDIWGIDADILWLESDMATAQADIDNAEVDIDNLETDLWLLDGRVSTLEWQTGLTTTITVKDGAWVNKVLGFTNGKLTSIT